MLPKLLWPFLFGIKGDCNLIRFRIQHLSLSNGGATLLTPLEIMDRSVSGVSKGFTSGAILGIIFMRACGAVPIGTNKLQEEPATDQEVKENEIKFTKCLKRKCEEGQSRSRQLGSDCRITTWIRDCFRRHEGCCREPRP